MGKGRNDVSKKRQTHGYASCTSIANEYTRYDDDMPTIVIHDMNAQEHRLDSRRCLLNIALNDQESGPDAITPEQASIIAEFALSCIRRQKSFVICCPGGVGRSIAVWCAIVHMTAEDPDEDMRVWDSQSYAPNHRIFETVCEAIAETTNPERNYPEESQRRYLANRTAWMRRFTYYSDE